VEFADLPEKFQVMREILENTPSLSADFTPNAPEITPDQQAEAPLLPLGGWENGRVDFNMLINEFETQLIMHAMKLASGNKKEAARLLNLKRTTLLEKIKKKDLTLFWEE
jgi:DNA-binding NtrC family response regulator